MTITYVALGSNLGDRRQYLSSAVDALRAHSAIKLLRVSSIHETDPVGGPLGQDKYLNAAVEIETTLSADALMHVLLEIEKSLGRERGERNGPRTIDLDLLLFGALVQASEHLTVPHPHVHEREFVLRPLVEIAPRVVHPKLGRTIQELLHDLSVAVRRELSGMRVMVTGSTSGIGRAIALELGRAGANVLVHGRRSQAAAESISEQIASHNASSHVLMADLSDADVRAQFVKDAWCHWDGLDAWINNAGADTLTGDAAKWTFEQKLEALWQVDVEATIHLSRAIGERMRSAGGGVILNVGWDQAETGMEGDSGQLFGAVKSAVMAFSKSLALTLAPTVRVNCLAPGWIRTAWGEAASETWQRRAIEETPMRRWGMPEDVAAAARWFVSPAAAYVTGQVIRVNGGTVR